MLQYSKIIQNPTHLDLQKSANQGRRCTWEKLSAIKANCGIELALDECVAILNHMRRLKRSAERAAAAAAATASHGPPIPVKFSASRRIPSWNCIARENSTGSLEEEYLADITLTHNQGVGGSIGTGSSGRMLRTHRNMFDGSDSESENIDLNTWTRSGGPLMRTASANKFIDFVQNLDLDDLNRGLVANSNVLQTVGGSQNSQSPRTMSERSSESPDFDPRELSNRVSSSILLTEGDFLQPERIPNGIVFNVVKKEDLTLTSRSHDSETQNSEVECLQVDRSEQYVDASSASDYDGNEEDATPKGFLQESLTINNLVNRSEEQQDGHDHISMDS